LPLPFCFAPPYAFPAFNQEYDVLPYDEDSPDPDQPAGDYCFKLSDATTISYRYPDTILLFGAGNALRTNRVLDWG